MLLHIRNRWLTLSFVSQVAVPTESSTVSTVPCRRKNCNWGGGEHLAFSSSVLRRLVCQKMSCCLSYSVCYLSRRSAIDSRCPCTASSPACTALQLTTYCLYLTLDVSPTICSQACLSAPCVAVHNDISVRSGQVSSACMSGTFTTVQDIHLLQLIDDRDGQQRWTRSHLHTNEEQVSFDKRTVFVRYL